MKKVSVEQNTLKIFIYLQVALRIPVGIVKNNDIGCREIDTKASSTCGKKEGKFGWSLFVEIFDHLLPDITPCWAINSTVLKISKNHVVFQNIQKAGHLAEDENAGALFL